MTKYQLDINGTQYTVEASPNMPLLWVLRDKLGLKGTKFGCGKGLCGSCTVHINNSATRSCQVPISSLQGQTIKTIEGLSKDGDHPLQVAWQELSVPQCGYCQPGQLMSAAALLAQTAKPSSKEIDGAMSGNICRCGTYLRIKKGILKASGQSEARSS